MGNNNSDAIKINLDRNAAVYYTDETISGRNLTVDKFYIKLTGEEGKAIRETTIHENDQASLIYTGKNDRTSFYSIKIPFIQSQPGEKGLVLNSGEYSWSFEIPLQNDLPPTINPPEWISNIRYYLQVVISTPWYRPDTRETRYLKMYPRVNLLQNPQYLTSNRFSNENRKLITLRRTVNKTEYLPNESINNGCAY